MERIGKVLGNLDRGTPTQDLKNLDGVKYDIPELDPRYKEPTLEERRESLRRSLGLSSLDHTFENFIKVKGTEKALAAFKSIVSDNYKRKFLLCYGGVGNGKTNLCEAASIALYKSGTFCKVNTMARMMMALKGCMNSKSHLSYEELLNNYCYADRLIIDDVGMGGSGSDWEYGQLEEIILVRYRERLFTILTTNRDITELPERITSRFFDPDVGTVVLNEGADYRRMK